MEDQITHHHKYRSYHRSYHKLMPSHVKAKLQYKAAQEVKCDWMRESMMGQ